MLAELEANADVVHPIREPLRRRPGVNSWQAMQRAMRIAVVENDCVAGGELEFELALFRRPAMESARKPKVEENHVTATAFVDVEIEARVGGVVHQAIWVAV